MKTIEQKAKAYDEVLEKAKAHINSKGIGDTVDLCKHLFPQLRESEDERIRKETISIVQSYMNICDEDGDPCLSGYKVLNWLEKQKETLHISESCKENADSFTDACKDVIVAIEKYLDWLTGYPDYAPKGKYSLRDMLHCLSLLEKQKEQSLRDFIDDFPYSDQNEQKPEEWNEEDADILNCCISSIEEAKENRYAYKETDGDTSYDEEIVWLKSLRPQPHWKPSEEQMEALENSTALTEQQGEALYSLVCDLKKLCQ